MFFSHQNDRDLAALAAMLRHKAGIGGIASSRHVTDPRDSRWLLRLGDTDQNES
jgi:hypothetical protein